MFEYDFGIKNWKELRYALLDENLCPTCSDKLYRVDVLPELSSGWERNGFNLRYRFSTKDGFRYRCDPCHAYFSLSELAAKA